MIDIHREEIVSFADAGRHLPHRRGGSTPHPSTIYRWARNGVRGIRLEWVKVGATRCTSIEALQRFVSRLTDQEIAGSEPDPKCPDFESELDEAGF